MSRTSIILAGWLTTTVALAVVIVGMGSGVFNKTNETVQANQNSGALLQEAEQASISGFGTGPLGQDLQPYLLDVSDPQSLPSTQGQVQHVYPDGSPAPDPNKPQAVVGKEIVNEPGDGISSLIGPTSNPAQTPDQNGEIADLVTPADEVIYVYPDGSPAQLEPIAPLGYDDDRDDDHEDYDHDDEHDEWHGEEHDDDDHGISGLVRRFLGERGDDD